MTSSPPKSPYEGLAPRAFWKAAVAETSPLALRDIYRRKWPIQPGDRIATAGSCFAQHVARHLRGSGFAVMDVEPPPPGLPAEQIGKFGYGLYSARYGNVYTTRQLLQLVREAAGTWAPQDYAWPMGDRFIDAFRPAVEPEGLDSPQEVALHRAHHVARVRDMFQQMDVLIFTLGLTEAWRDRVTGTVYPTAPGTVAGRFDPDRFEFVNFTYPEILADLNEAIAIIDSLRPGKSPFRLLLTVSPVPLTATAAPVHVLAATTWSKSTLRAVAGDLENSSPRIDYFPSFEIVTNPASRGVFYAANLRSVMTEGVQVVMQTFMAAHKPDTASAKAAPVPAAPAAPASDPPSRTADDVQCEEALLEAFAPGGARA